jgi:uncharacterized membrane protein
MNKKIYYATFGIAPALCFLLALVTKFPITGGCVDVSDIAVFVVSVICGPLVALTCGVGVALSDIVTGHYLIAPFSGVIASLVGFLSGYLFKNAFAFMQMKNRKFLSILCGVGLAVILWFASSFLINSTLSVALVTFMFRALISLSSGLIACFILPKDPNFLQA